MTTDDRHTTGAVLHGNGTTETTDASDDGTAAGGESASGRDTSTFALVVAYPTSDGPSVDGESVRVPSGEGTPLRSLDGERDESEPTATIDDSIA